MMSLDIRTLPDLLQRRDFDIEPVAGAYPDFEAGELVEVLPNASGTRTVRKITGAISTTPAIVFQNTEDDWIKYGTHLVCVIEAGLVQALTNQFIDALVGETEGAGLTVDVAGAMGTWKVAASGDTVFATLNISPAATKANGGTMEFTWESKYVIP
jgi:hypothetical protein